MKNFYKAALEKSVEYHRNLANKILNSPEGYQNWECLKDDFDFANEYVEAVKESGNTLQVAIDTPLDFWYMDVEGMTRKIQQTDKKNIEVMINSIGGSVIVGMGLYNALRYQAEKNQANIVAVNTGVVASSAVMPYLAADNRYAGTGMTFVHNVQGFLFGAFSNDAEADALVDDSKEMRNKIEEEMLTIYDNRLPDQKLEDIKAALKKETLYTSNEALDMGYATNEGLPTAEEKPEPRNADHRVSMAMHSMRGMLARK